VIELGPKGGIEERSAVPERLPVALVVTGVSKELNLVSLLISELENNLLNLPFPEKNTDAIRARQSIDMVQQSVDVLAFFLSRIAEQCGSWDVQVANSLSEVSLGSMRERLIRGTEAGFRQDDAEG